MTFSNDTKLTEITRLARHLALATLVAAPLHSDAALLTPRRPATLEPTQANVSSRPVARARQHRPYLAMVGPSALTFADPEPPLPPEPVMPEPPKPKIEPAKTTPENRGSASADTNADTALTPKTDHSDTTPAPDNQGPKPISILPDDTRREIRAEDVLPYFQFPGASLNGNAPTIVINPAPPTAPPSSATYRQQ